MTGTAVPSGPWSGPEGLGEARRRRGAFGRGPAPRPDSEGGPALRYPPDVFRVPLRPVAAGLLALTGVAAVATPVQADAASTASAHFAAELMEQPAGEAVVVSDALAGDYDLGLLEESLRRSFARLDVPHYVIAGPLIDSPTSWRDVPAIVHDRIGADGIYVYLGPLSSLHAESYGVDLPVDDAELVVNDHLDYDTAIGATGADFVDLLLDPEVTAMAEEVRSGYATPEDVGGEGPVESFLEDIDPRRHNGAANLGFLAGTLAGAALTAGGIAVLVRRDRAKAAEEKAATAKGRRA
ncbi:hypothetical protein GCM10027294_44010 [Marinactinospora endophytica]